MATVWAKSNGNWTDTTLWAFWNENTQSIEDYGQVPQDDDIVFANGFTISVGNGFSFNGTFCNGHGEHTSNSGGKLQCISGTIYVKTLICTSVGYVVLFHPLGYGQSGTLNFQNAYCTNNYNSLVQSDAGPLALSGNIYCEGNVSLSAYSSYALTINGNLYCETSCNINWAGGALYLNGIFENVYCDATRQFIINGSVTVAPNQVFKTTNANSSINGNIKYSGSGYFDFFNFNILNPTTITIKDISAQRVNPFIIVTDYEINNTTNYPAETDVKKDVPYAYGQLKGTFEPNYPPESVVLDGFEYGEDMTGTMTQSVQVGCVTKEDVREGVPLIGMYEDGQQVVGTIVIPNEEDVREGVHYDNDKIGTLIPSSGGSRLRVVDYAFYTTPDFDTYVADIDAPTYREKFATAEEVVLLSILPDNVDVDNLPAKYFDDLFVKALKYRVLVEYYRGAGINSTFTPSEPTTEVVNYSNDITRYWLNKSNVYLDKFAKKYPGAVKPQRILF